MAAYEASPSTLARRQADAGVAEKLPARLRRETASLHARVEAVTGLPGSVRRRGDYVTLLQRLHGFHAAVETRLRDPRWAGDWAGLGLDLTEYRRAHLLVEDLAAMQEPAPPEPPPDFRLGSSGSFAGALGCLYVAEGSSLGGRVIGPAIRSAVGDVPIAFFESAERRHPSPWRTLTAALHRFDDDGGDADAVVEGARHTFLAFEQLVATPNRSAGR